MKKIFTLLFLSLALYAQDLQTYFNHNNCNQILENDGYFKTCYSYDYKTPIFGYARIYANKIHELNIEKRPRFYDDKNIPKKYRSYYSDYTKSGFDRGHMIANDANFDYSSQSLLSTYAMSNITPQYPNTNRKSFLKVERYERMVTSKLGYLDIYTFNIFDKNPMRIGKNQVAVPKEHVKMLFSGSFQKCFVIPNDNVIYKLKQMQVDCDVIRGQLIY